MTDPIADFLTRIRNTQMARKSTLSLPYSKVKHEIAKVMKKNKFLVSCSKDESEKFPMLVLELPSEKLELKRVSRPGQRMYFGAQEIRKVNNGFGISIFSTSKGVVTGYEARSMNVGGECLCYISSF
jgi:small subunit ribosomal protein S8